VVGLVLTLLLTLLLLELLRLLLLVHVHTDPSPRGDGRRVGGGGAYDINVVLTWCYTGVTVVSQ
jgi:hypothetical protein